MDSVPTRIQSLLSEGMTRLGLSATGHQLSQLVHHLQELASWSDKISLTAYRSDRARAIHLTLDSAIFVRLLPPLPGTLLDVGSGAGFPGVVIKILRPDLRVVLVEANRKRGNFLKHLQRELNLQDCEVIIQRLEAVQASFVAGFDAITLRAVAQPETALRLAEPLLKPGGILLLPLAPRAPAPRPLEAPDTEICTVQLPFSGVTRRILRIRRKEIGVDTRGRST